MKYRSELSVQLRRRREDLDLSLTQLARRTDTSAATLSRYESGWTRFEIYTLRKLATALGCELEVKLIPKAREKLAPSGSDLVATINRLFWDRSLEERHLEENSLWVVERVLEYGALGDLESLVAFFGRETFLRLVSAARFSSEKSRVFWEHMLCKEGMECTRKFSRKEAATSWRSSRG